MKAVELINLLSKFPLDMEVRVDTEGGGTAPVTDVDMETTHEETYLLISDYPVDR